MLINSPEEMKNFGSQIASHHDKILLYGDLGAGKTLFTKWYAKALGISEKIVQSPTYTYLNIYDNKLLHIDFYRLNSLHDIIEKGILDQMQHFEHIIIERPRFEQELDLNYMTKITIDKIEEWIRKTTITLN